MKILYADGFNDALLGIAERGRHMVAVYSVKSCVEILMRRDGMDHEGALHYFYSIEESFVGPEAPIWVYHQMHMVTQ